MGIGLYNSWILLDITGSHNTFSSVRLYFTVVEDQLRNIFQDEVLLCIQKKERNCEMILPDHTKNGTPTLPEISFSTFFKPVRACFDVYSNLKKIQKKMSYTKKLLTLKSNQYLATESKF